MRLVIAAVGRLKDEGEGALLARYARRIASGRAIGLGPLAVEDVNEGRAADVEARRTDEASRLLKVAGSSEALLALDERGRALSSVEFANLLARLRDDGVQSAAFLLGGPDGHADSLRKACRHTLSLGPMTLPHGLARVVLVEQIYRAITILSGHPYHRS